MTRIRMVGLALVAVFAFSAIAVASASAIEVLLVLEGGGVITPGSVTYTSKTEPGVPLVIQTVKPGSKLACDEETNRGTITGPKTSESIVTVTGCESSVSGKKCQSGSVSGEIVETVDTKLGIVKASNEEYGVLADPSPAAKFECGAAFKQEIKGSVILSILKLNGGTVKLNTPFLTWDISGHQTKGVQSILKFEGEGNQLLEDSENGGTFEMLGLEIEVLETFSKKVELSSTK
jgi:hypothetical protein